MLRKAELSIRRSFSKPSARQGVDGVVQTGADGDRSQIERSQTSKRHARLAEASSMVRVRFVGCDRQCENGDPSNDSFEHLWSSLFTRPGRGGWDGRKTRT